MVCCFVHNFVNCECESSIYILSEGNFNDVDDLFAHNILSKVFSEYSFKFLGDNSLILDLERYLNFFEVTFYDIGNTDFTSSTKFKSYYFINIF